MVRRKPQPAGDAVHVRVHRDHVAPHGEAQDARRGLHAHALEARQVVERLRVVQRFEMIEGGAAVLVPQARQGREDRGRLLL